MKRLGWHRHHWTRIKKPSAIVNQPYANHAPTGPLDRTLNRILNRAPLLIAEAAP
jgi:hypothetical protein